MQSNLHFLGLTSIILGLTLSIGLLEVKPDPVTRCLNRSWPDTLRDEHSNAQARSIFRVTTNADSGPGSLRAAIQQVNANVGPDAIDFSLPSGQLVITPLTPLPPLTDSDTFMDGTTQPGYSGAPIVVLDGARAGSSAAGLVLLSSAGHQIRGLSIINFGVAGVYIESADGNTLSQNYLGVDSSGQVAGPNGIGVLIRGRSHGNRVGDPNSSMLQNVISGNSGPGVHLDSSNDATTNWISGNYIGTAVDGIASLPNGDDGIRIQVDNLQTPSIGAWVIKNLISGNLGDGIQVSKTLLVEIEANTIGITAESTRPKDLPNGGHGIYILDDSGNTHIEDNVISGNRLDGIRIENGSGADEVQRNLIGVAKMNYPSNPDSKDRRPNDHGVYVWNTSGLTIAANVIAGNDNHGLVLAGDTTNNCRIENNYIGYDDIEHGEIDGLFNRGHGILLTGDVNRTMIVGNTNATNSESGIGFDSQVGNGNTLLRNLVFENRTASVDLLLDGRTLNDADDADSGPNRLQNFPELSEAYRSGSDLIVEGDITSRPSFSAYPIQIDFYWTGLLQPEAREYLGTTSIISGPGHFLARLPARDPIGFVVALATDAHGNSSEISDPVSIDRCRATNVGIVALEGENSGAPHFAQFEQFVGVFDVSEGGVAINSDEEIAFTDSFGVYRFNHRSPSFDLLARTAAGAPTTQVDCQGFSCNFVSCNSGVFGNGNPQQSAQFKVTGISEDGNVLLRGEVQQNCGPCTASGSAIVLAKSLAERRIVAFEDYGIAPTGGHYLKLDGASGSFPRLTRSGEPQYSMEGYDCGTQQSEIWLFQEREYALKSNLSGS